MYTKDPNEVKYQLQINKQKYSGLKHFNNFQAFIEFSNDMANIYKNIEECNPNKNRKTLIVFDYLIANMLNNKKLNPIVT